MTQPEQSSWDTLSLALANDSSDFAHWEDLTQHALSHLTKSSTTLQLSQFRITLDQLLLKYPFLEQYWVLYAQKEFQLGETGRAKMVWCRALSVLPWSLKVWCEYLKFIKEVGLGYESVLKWFREAEEKCGYHYHAYEFWRMYLEFEEAYHGKSTFWWNLLKKCTEIPLYNYGYFFKLLFAGIETLKDKETVLKIVDSTELKKKLKVDARSEWTDATFHDVRAKLKKTYTDLYITTQFKTFEIYQYEKNVKLEYYVPRVYQSYQDLVNWDQYLSYMEINALTKPQITQLYHRALIPTANYPNIWLKFAEYYIHNGKLQSAKNLLYTALGFMTDANLVPVQLKLIKIEMALENYIRARDLILASLSKNGENVELLIELMNVEYLLMSQKEVKSEDYVKFVISLLNDKPAELGIALLRHLLGFKLLEMDLPALLEGCKDSLRASPQFWVLMLSYAKDGESVYQEALKEVGEHELIVRWRTEHGLLDARDAYARSTAALGV